VAEKEKKPVLERTYTVPLRKSFINAPMYRKTNKAVSGLRAFLLQHMKGTEVKLGQHLNRFLWQRGIKSPPPRVKVHAVKDEAGVVRAELEGKAFLESVRALPKEEESGSLKDRLTSKLKGSDKESAESASEPDKKGE
jgi:large subunit ribosomal protein L31e